MAKRSATPTDLNMAVFDREITAGGGVIQQLPAPSVPHMRRILDAGYLEPVEGARTGVWRASAAGREALARYRAGRSSGSSDNLRAGIRDAARHYKNGRLVEAAFVLGMVWSRIDGDSDPVVHEAADDLRVKLGL